MITADERSRVACPVMCNPAKSPYIRGKAAERAPSQRLDSILHKCVHLNKREADKCLSRYPISEPVEETTCLSAAIQHRYRGKPALVAHPPCILSTDLAAARSPLA